MKYLAVTLILILASCSQEPPAPIKAEYKQQVADAKLILYGLSTIENGKYITRLDRVLWGEADLAPGYILESSEANPGWRRGDAQIIFYDNEFSNSYGSSWSVYDGRIPAWGDKDIKEFISYLKAKTND